jgi:hypothetical protein
VQRHSGTAPRRAVMHPAAEPEHELALSGGGGARPRDARCEVRSTPRQLHGTTAPQRAHKRECDQSTKTEKLAAAAQERGTLKRGTTTATTCSGNANMRAPSPCIASMCSPRRRREDTTPERGSTLPHRAGSTRMHVSTPLGRRMPAEHPRDLAPVHTHHTHKECTTTAVTATTATTTATATTNSNNKRRRRRRRRRTARLHDIAPLQQ